MVSIVSLVSLVVLFLASVWIMHGIIEHQKFLNVVKHAGGWANPTRPDTNFYYGDRDTCQPGQCREKTDIKDVTTPEECWRLAKKEGKPFWQHSNEYHPRPEYRNTCSIWTNFFGSTEIVTTSDDEAGKVVHTGGCTTPGITDYMEKGCPVI